MTKPPVRRVEMSRDHESHVTSDDLNQRRAVLGVIAAVAFAPMVATAQQPIRIRRIGFLANTAPFEPELDEAYWRTLRDRGWREGENLLIERRYASERNELLQAMADELVKLRVELIVGHGTIAALATPDARKAA